MNPWARWVQFTGRRIDARPLRLVMAFIPLCILGDAAAMVWRGALPAVLYSAAFGGINATHHPSLFLGHAPWVGPALWWTMVMSSVLVLLGQRVASGRLLRPALLVLLVASAQFGHFYVPGDRGIDRILRTVMVLLLFSEVSAPGARKTVAAWPADLLKVLLAIVYVSAGEAKIGAAPGWTDPTTPELYTILAAPMVGRLDAASWYGHPLPFVVGGVFTLVLEYTSFLLLTRWARYWAVLGAALHVGLVLTMELGMFPFGMLALYPVLLAPWTEQVLDRISSATGVGQVGDASPAPRPEDASPEAPAAAETSR